MLLAAYTPATGPGYPPYFNATQDGDEVIVTVRGGPSRDMGGMVIEGPTGMIRVPREVFDEFFSKWNKE